MLLFIKLGFFDILDILIVAFIFYYGYNKLLPNIEVFWRVL
mgnify:CR=1 FL=1